MRWMLVATLVDGRELVREYNTKREGKAARGIFERIGDVVRVEVCRQTPTQHVVRS